MVCAIVMEEFLPFSKSKGDDLITPISHFQFSGLKTCDKWCLGVSRCREAYLESVAPPVILEATNEKALRYVSFEALFEHKV